MQHNEHEQHHHGPAPEHKHGHPHHRKPIHKDWRAWVVVALMLAAMVMYVLTMDESIRPGSNVQTVPMPAAP